MTKAVSDLYAAALALPDDERAELSELLAESVEPPPAGLHPAWGPELRRRAARLDSGEVKAVPLAEFLKTIDDQLAAGSVRG